MKWYNEQTRGVKLMIAFVVIVIVAEGIKYLA
jgi:hypothetical protein